MSKKQNIKYKFVKNYLLKLFGTLILITAILIVILFLIQGVFRNIIAGLVSGTFLYEPLIYLEENLLLVSVFVLLIVYGITILFYMGGLTKYINEIMETSGKIYDSNEEIRMSAPLKEVESQFLEIKEEVDKSKLVAKEADKRKNDLLVYLAHDLKTPLTSIIGYLTLLSEENELPKDVYNKYIKIAKDKSLRLEDLLNEFFDITRFNLSGSPLELEKVNFSLMIEQMIFEITPVYKQKNISCITNIMGDLTISADVNKLQRAIDNLLMNAYYYSYENSQITIDLKAINHKAVLTITNSSKTIPSEKLEKIFEQFYRLDSARGTETGKAGLGLAITKEIIDAHKGEIQVDSFDEKTIFNIELNLMS